MKYGNTRCRSALSRSRLPGLDYALNPYRGCEHGCLYCYSPAVLKDQRLIEHWGEEVWAKENVVEVLAKEVRKFKPGVVGVSTVCDPYQPLERKTELTRRCLEVLSGSEFGVCIQTKSDLVLRDLDLIKGERFEVGTTVTTLDPDLARKLEPGAPLPERRLAALGEFAARGVETWVFLGPVIPEVNDSPDGLLAVLEEARRLGTYVIYDRLNLKTGVLQRLEKGFGEETAARISGMLGQNSDWWSKTRSRIERMSRELGIRCAPAFE